MRIIEGNYQRVVGPNVVSLKQYEVFSSTVYGELMPYLVHRIVHITGLREESLFLDLGSGLGNVVVQASLQTGCRSYGIQPMSAPARIARDMAEQTRIRCRGHTRMMLGEAFIVLLRLPTISMTLQELAQNHCKFFRCTFMQCSQLLSRLIRQISLSHRYANMQSRLSFSIIFGHLAVEIRRGRSTSKCLR